MTTSAIVASGTSSALRARVAASNAASEAFFSEQGAEIARACQLMAVRFQAGGRLLVHAGEARASDVSHAVVEFMHPVVVGKRALPALRLGALSQLAVIGCRGDMLLLLADGALGNAERRVLPEAAAAGILTVALVGGSGVTPHASPDYLEFAVCSADPCVVQEVHEMLYHVLWELVHVFVDHGVA